MRYFNGLGSLGRNLPSGTLKLLALAMLLSMAVFGTRADAADTETEPEKVNEPIAESTDIKTAYTYNDGDIVIGDPGKQSVKVAIDKGGSIATKNAVEIIGDTVVTGKTLVVGSIRDTDEKSQYLSASSLLRGSDSATLFFEEVIVTQGKDVHSLNLGAIDTEDGATDSVSGGGIYVGTYDKIDASNALYTKTLATDSSLSNTKGGDKYVESTIYVLGDVTLAKDGKITLVGHRDDGSGGISGQKVDATGKAVANSFESTFTMTGGTLDMTSMYGASVVMQNVNIQDGTAILKVSPNASTGKEEISSWLDGPSIVGGAIGADDAGYFNISGGDIQLGNYGTLRTYSTTRGEAANITISGGTILMDGEKDKEAMIIASDDATQVKTSASMSKLYINDKDGDTQINVDGHGVILSRHTEFSGGDINVAGKLTVAGAAATSFKVNDKTYDYESVLDGIKDDSTAKWGNFIFNGGTMNLTGNGIVDFVTGNMTVSAKSGALNGTLYISDTVGTTSAMYTNDITIDGGFTVTNLAIAAASETNKGITINNGGGLAVTGTVTADAKATDLLTINSGGTLTANADDFFETLKFNNKAITENEWSNLASFSNLEDFKVDADLKNALNAGKGTLYLIYDEENGDTLYSITSEELAAMEKALGVGNLVISGLITGDQTNVITDKEGGFGNKVTNPSVTVTVDTPDDFDGRDTITFEKEVTVKDIDVKDKNVDKIIFGDDITFTGSSNITDHLIDIEGDKPGDLTAKANLTLGIPGLSAGKGGVLGDVLFDGSTRSEQFFKVNEGDFTVGNVSSTTRSGDVNIVVDNARLTTGTIDLSKVDRDKYKTTVLVDNQGTLTIKGDLVLNNNEKSGITLDNGSTLTADNISGARYLDVDGGSTLTATNITMDDNSTIYVGNGTIIADVLELGVGSTINACHTDSPGSFVMTEAKLNGGTIFTDPAWDYTSNSQDPYKATSLNITHFSGVGGRTNITDGNLIIGQNSHFTYGYGKSDWIVESINHAGEWGPTGDYRLTAAVGLYKPLVLGDANSLIVDGSIKAKSDTDKTPVWSDGTAVTPSATTTTAYFAPHSLLVVNAANVGANQAALSTQSGTGTLMVDAGARLYVSDGKAGQVFTLVDGFDDIDDGTGEIGVTAWNTEQNLTNSAMTNVVLSLNANQKGYTASITSNNAEDIYENASGGSSGIINEIYRPGANTGLGLNDNNSSNSGIRFVSRATDKDWNGTNLDRHIATIEGAAQIAAVGGAQMQAFNIMRMSQDAIRQRFSFSNGLIPHPDGSCKHPGDIPSFESDDALGSMFNMTRFNVEGKKIVSVWASPVYQRNRVSGSKVGNFDNSYRTNLGGANFGVDFDLGDNYRFGIVGDFGGGKAKTKESIFARTENEIDWAGISAYGAWSTCNLSVLVDGGYDRISNKLKQDNWLGGVQNRAKMKANAWNVGVTAEYLVVAGKFDIVPHAGFRYEGLGNNSYTVRDNTGDLFNVGSDTQHVLSIPVGVTFSRDFNIGCKWRITPYADLGALFSVGNRDYKTTVNIPTLSGHQFRSRILDAAAFDGKAGVNVDRGRFTGGVNYNLTASGKQTSHSLWATLGLNF